MGVAYAVAYHSRITPWENEVAGTDAAFQRLLDREEVGRDAPFGRALDLGCGTGAHTRALYARGWDVLGVDNVRHAVDLAISRGGESSRYVIGDVAYLPGSGVGKNFSLFLDVGCFQGLRDRTRLAMGRGVTTLAAPDAKLLMLSHVPNHNPFLPRGADADALARAFPDWQLLDVRDADTSELPGAMRRHRMQWFRLGLAA